MNSPRKIRNLVGPIPNPAELYGREALIANLWNQIQGNNILLIAPRRFGKSGIMRHVLLNPPPEFLPLYFELEDVNSPEEFVWRITEQLLRNDQLRFVLHKARGLPTAITKFIKQTFDEAEFQGAKLKFKEEIKKDWRESAKRMLLEMEKADRTIIFILDEFPSMLEEIRDHCGKETAHEILGWFRSVRLEQKDVLRRHRFIVAGSIGIDTILRDLNASDKLNDFQRLYVEPLDEEAALQLASDLAFSSETAWSDASGRHLLGLIGSPVPYFIHLFFSQLGLLSASRRVALDNGALDATYRSRLLGPTCKSYFDHYSTRLKRLGKPGEKAAIAMLRAVAAAPQKRVSLSALYDIYRKTRGRGFSDEEFNRILGELEHDWYLVLDSSTNEYHFLIKIMHDWWNRWYPLRGGTRGEGAAPK
jgi:hypothetical protein